MNSAKPRGQNGESAVNLPSKPELNYYKILDVRESADRMEIRESYVRLKKTFSGQNQALYSLVSQEESAKALGQVEEAFRVLDDDQQRAAYDKMLFGTEGKLAEASYTLGDSFNNPALDRLETGDPFQSRRDQGGEPLAPSSHHVSQQINHLSTDAISDTMRGLKSATRLVSDWTPEVTAHTYVPKQYPPIEKVLKRALKEDVQGQIAELVARSDIGSGLLYREIREMLEVSRHEIQEKTKISPEYVIAIEENAFHILPAAVYVNGFVKSYLEYLGVDRAGAIAKAFVERFQKWQAAERP